MSKVIGLIMTGGMGTRFWPESNSQKPKQYLSLISNNSLLEDTVERLKGVVSESFGITTENQVSLVTKYSSLNQDHCIIEPNGRNTAPCIFLSLVSLLEKGFNGEDVVTIVPSDHVILNATAFQKNVNEAVKISQSNNCLVTIGIRPTFPHTGFGYIKKQPDGKVSEFKEKPDLETAKSYLASGEYVWNAGMFIGKISTFLSEFEKHANEFLKYRDDLIKNTHETYQKLPAISIDYAIMEKSDNLYVVSSDFDWNDLGSWDAMESVIEKNNENTFVSNNNDSVILESKGNIIFAPEKLVALSGVNDMIIVCNDDVLMALPKKNSQDVKKIVEKMKDNEDLKKYL